jgi:hypothetical protein
MTSSRTAVKTDGRNADYAGVGLVACFRLGERGLKRGSGIQRQPLDLNGHTEQAGRCPLSEAEQKRL